MQNLCKAYAYGVFSQCEKLGLKAAIEAELFGKNHKTSLLNNKKSHVKVFAAGGPNGAK